MYFTFVLIASSIFKTGIHWRREASSACQSCIYVAQCAEERIMMKSNKFQNSPGHTGVLMGITAHGEMWLKNGVRLASFIRIRNLVCG